MFHLPTIRNWERGLRDRERLEEREGLVKLMNESGPVVCIVSKPRERWVSILVLTRPAADRFPEHDEECDGSGAALLSELVGDVDVHFLSSDGGRHCADRAHSQRVGWH